MDAEVSMHTFLTMIIEQSLCFMSYEPIFFCNYSYVVHTNIYIFFFIDWTFRMSDNLPERVQILGHTHILCITVWEHRIICCQIFCDLLLKSAFEWIFNVMQLILVKIKWKYLIQKFHDIGLSYLSIIERITVSIKCKTDLKLFCYICHWLLKSSHFIQVRDWTVSNWLVGLYRIRKC